MEETNYFFWANPFPTKVVESNIVKIKGHSFTGVYPSPVLMKLEARKYNMLSCLFLKNKVEVVFSLFSNFNYSGGAQLSRDIQNEPCYTSITLSCLKEIEFK